MTKPPAPDRTTTSSAKDGDAASPQMITRFAPSPTGFLHIGGARTALFNWLLARSSGGKFLLRIEDTDRERSTEAAVAAILDGLSWLELDWDGEPIYQFQRAGRHREVAEEMVRRGMAYHCYATPTELEEMREKAQQEGRSSIYDGRWRDRDPSEAPAGAKPAVRVKTPRTGQTVVADRVQGAVTIANKDLDDLIILRSDGTPTYNLAVVVDDHDMGITHVVRGVDHLTNAARQTQIYNAMGWPVPVFAHVPLIHGPDGAKLSKRHGAQGVGEFRAMGYLPVALRNYLVRLGWSHGDQELFSTEEMLALFSLDNLGKSAARFDFKKLADINGHYIRQARDGELLDRIRAALPEMEHGGQRQAALDRVGWERFGLALPTLKERAKTLVELVEGAAYLTAVRPLPLEEKAAGVLDVEARATLATLHARLSQIGEWTTTALDAAVRGHGEATGTKLGKLAQPLRAALTGKTVSPPVFDMMAALGREESLARIADQVIST